MKGEWVPDPSVESWKGLGSKVIEGFVEEWPACAGCGVCKGTDDPFVSGAGIEPASPDGAQRPQRCASTYSATRTSGNESSASFERDVDGILAELRELMLRKHRDYGPLNIALAPGGAINGLRVRMHDKLARINNLTDKQAEPENESLQDSFGDLANYGIIGLMVLRGLWPGTEGK